MFLAHFDVVCLYVVSGVWEEKLRVGEVGGNTLGLYGCQFSPDGNTILAHGYQGAFTVWHLSQLNEVSSYGVCYSSFHHIWLEIV